MRWEFWTLDLGAGSVDVLPGLLKGELLLAQLVAQQGKGKLTLEANGGQFSMHLTIPRADATPSPSEEAQVLPTAVAVDMVNHIAQVVIDSLLQIGHRLPSALAEATEHYEMPPGVEGDREAMAEWLQSTHGKFSGNLQSVADYWEEVQQHIAKDFSVVGV